MYIHALIKRLAMALGVYQDAEDHLRPVCVRIWTGNNPDAAGDADDANFVDLPIKAVRATWDTSPVLVVDQAKLPKFQTDTEHRIREARVMRLRGQANQIRKFNETALDAVHGADLLIKNLEALANDLEGK